MLEGKGPKLHHFTAGEKGADNKAQCSALEGSVCHTSAHIAENKDMQGRAIKSSVEVEGDGCLPSMCLNQGDLIWRRPRVVDLPLVAIQGSLILDLRNLRQVLAIHHRVSLADRKSVV